MRAILTALLLTIATQAGVEYGNLCEKDWWETATTADVQAELDGGADVTARKKNGASPLHRAAQSGTPANIQALLSAGADVMALAKDGSTPLQLAAEFGNPEVIQPLLDVVLTQGSMIQLANPVGLCPRKRKAQRHQRLLGAERRAV